jgi:hypothetical protein
MSQKKYQRKLQTYGSDKMVLIHLVLKMIPPNDNDDSELKKFLVLSKECN